MSPLVGRGADERGSRCPAPVKSALRAGSPAANPMSSSGRLRRAQTSGSVLGPAGETRPGKRCMFALTADHLAIRDMAKSFADERLAPNALRWDEEEHFPADVLREA